ncbi:hypothetical protein ASPVEDRAFT_128077 [Aspergillus versicolor CBS 583.65]|uniref:AB hydrolase-1 domain-containing protein n=1 Tax=Aspergillus versicolor CBS 583.65 TaxID=1036611 RepID=A0A1L9PFZ2_ASPVE|nr:uncharacterized protein ASPVEDRAFT_128077 [Aspergillus versicolor CBS 583.65]OJJ00403.1 hypothetical protein ASPVEDRAFT_128077 [Aspergillus versicolor CBS 583.65]
MAASYPGILHNYAPRLVAFEFGSPSTPKPHSLLFIGGLTDGLYTVPYVQEIAKALEPTEWSIYHLHLSSSYSGWGIGSLDRDVEEIGQCVEYVRNLKKNSTANGTAGKVVIMGHSTGSQDVLHYVYSENPLPRNPDADGVQGLTRPVVDGAIMQAPVSDREAILQTAKESSEAREAYDTLVKFAHEQPARTLCPLDLTGLVGLEPSTPVNVRRFWSLASPESPAKPSEDDLFSTDITDERLGETFGRVATRGLLRGTLVALYSGNDEYAPNGVDKEALMARWKRATDAGGVKKWDDEASGIIPGASHNVRDEGQAWLIEHVLNYLNRV